MKLRVTHDHYHVAHYHQISGDWEHRTYWHTHEHNHAELVHSHDYSQDEENARHGKLAHIHDHVRPNQPPD